MYNFIIQIAKQAGKILLDKMGDDFSVEVKNNNPKDIITSVDKEVNQFIIKKIREKFPGDDIYSEEGGGSKSLGKDFWTIDPIDGTANFSRHIPHFAICFGFVKSGVSAAGVVYNPITGELFSFQKGKGAFLNNKPIKKSKITELSKAHIFFHTGRDPKMYGWGGRSYSLLLEKACKTKNFSCASLDLCYVAAGRIEASVSGNMSTLDIAPALGILTETGGLSVDALGNSLDLNKSPQKIFIANNKNILKSLLEILQ